ncbi:MAG: acyloxyacyl hydrolase [Balneola sp.]
MKFSLKAIGLTLISGFFLLNPIQAQEKLIDQPLQFRAWSGYSFESIYLLGKTKNARSLIVGIGARKPIRKYGNTGILYYTADIIPYIYYDYPKRDDNDRFVEHSGFGISPFGFLFEKQLNTVFSFQLGISGSFIFMEATFPTDKGRRLNYTFDPSFTLQTKLTNSLSVASGYKFHHISNAQTGKENPGLDSNFIFLSFILK